MENKKKSLSLDEMLGLGDQIVVVWKEKEFMLKHPSSFTPLELQRWEKLKKTATTMEKLEDDLTDVQAQELQDSVQAAVGLLNEKIIGEDVSFYGQVKILEFYTEQIVGSGPEESKKKEA